VESGLPLHVPSDWKPSSPIPFLDQKSPQLRSCFRNAQWAVLVEGRPGHQALCRMLEANTRSPWVNPVASPEEETQLKTPGTSTSILKYRPHPNNPKVSLNPWLLILVFHSLEQRPRVSDIHGP